MSEMDEGKWNLVMGLGKVKSKYIDASEVGSRVHEECGGE